MSCIFVRGKHVYRDFLPFSGKVFISSVLICSLACFFTTQLGADADNQESFQKEVTEKTLSDEAIRRYWYNMRGQYLLKIKIVNNQQTITSENGVYYFNDKKETYYSSNVLVHKDISKGWLDLEGFWHDSEGFYVVASIDHSKGEVVEVSKGKGRVLDDGCESGIVDFYVDW